MRARTACAVLVTDHHLPARRRRRGRAARRRRDRQPEPAWLHLREQGPGRRRRDVLRAAGAARRTARRAARSRAAQQPRLDALLDLVALGTVADVVRLDANNRRLVAQGLKRIRSGRMQPGIAALFAAAATPAGARGGVRLRLCAGPAHQRRRAPGRHDARHRMPAHRRRIARGRSGRGSSTPSTASGARSRPACANRPRPRSNT